MSFRPSLFTKVLLLWIAGAAIFGEIGLSMNFFQYRRLAAHGVATGGTVTALEPANHQFVDYSYIVAGRVFSRKGSAGFGNPPFGRLAVGDTVAAWYLPESPEISCLGYPDELLKNEEETVLGMAVVFPTFLLTVLSVRYASFRHWLTR